ncbi:MAG: hypothetical protein V7L13_30320 [Nostoc sp.]|uniref:hypothetical protein n=1 Tax=Nostoc sp. TaxID=1180 RepID=UPI002FF60A42
MSSKNLLEIMLTEKHLIIREGTIKEDSLIVKHFYQMWLDIGVDESNRVIEYLKAIACTRVVLNASPLGKPVYSSLGFSEGNVMQLDLI